MMMEVMFIEQSGLDAISCVSSVVFLKSGEPWASVLQRVECAVVRRETELQKALKVLNVRQPTEEHALRAWFRLTKCLDELAALYGQVLGQLSAYRQVSGLGGDVPDRKAMSTFSGNLFALEVQAKSWSEDYASLEQGTSEHNSGWMH